MAKKDFYDILGVSKGSSADEIKSAYRKLARDHHPDMVAKEDKEAAEKRFKEINEAYQVLSDPQKRKMYDQFGHAGFNGSAGGPGPGGYGGFGGSQGQWGPFSYTYTTNGQGFEGFDPFDVFEEFFGFRGFGGKRRPKRGKNLFYEMQIDFVDAVKGIEKEINIESGKIKVKVPPGVRNGTEMKFSGKGLDGPDGAPPGDLYITLRVPTPKEFSQRVGDNFGVVKELDFTQLALGDNVDVTIIDPNAHNGLGSAKLKIPSGTQPGTQFRLRGKGMPKLRGMGRGDVIVQVFVVVPKKLTRKQKKKLEEYQELLK